MFTTGAPSIDETGACTDRRRAATPTSPPIKPVRGEVVNKNKIGALASCALLVLTLGACGKSSSTSSTGSSSGASATISGAGSTFAAPVYQQWGSVISRLTVDYQPVRS